MSGEYRNHKREDWAATSPRLKPRRVSRRGRLPIVALNLSQSVAPQVWMERNRRVQKRRLRIVGVEGPRSRATFDGSPMRGKQHVGAFAQPQ